MPAEKSLALVLRVVPFSETSLVVTFFTEGLGKISALAKGARRPKSPFEAALDLLAVCRVVFLHKSSESLDLLTEARLERRFRSAERDLSRLYAGYYVAELLTGMTDEADPHPELFRQVLQTLQELDESGPVERLVLRFELTMLRSLGHLPSLADCANCGAAVEIRERVAFGQIAGGVLCPACRPGKKQVVSISAAAHGVLSVFADPGEEWKDCPLEPRWHGEVRGLLNYYLSMLLGRRPRLHRFLRLLAS